MHQRMDLECPSSRKGSLCRCRLEAIADGTADVVLEGNDQGLAAGQFACFYQDGICLGSAVILGDLSNPT